VIPKIVHLSWKDKNLFEGDSPLIIYGVKRLQDLNPDWNIRITIDEEINDYLNETMRHDFTLVEHKGIVAKTDIWRLYKLLYEGGIYVDIDRFCDVKLSEVIPKNVKQVLPVCRYYDFSHDLMISAPNNPVYNTTISMYLHRRKMGFDNIYFLGAQTYMHAITHTLVGEMINTNPGQEKFEEIINKIKNLGFIEVFVEDPPYFTFLYRNREDIGDWEKLKKEFYSKSGIKHWTGDW